MNTNAISRSLLGGTLVALSMASASSCSNKVIASEPATSSQRSVEEQRVRNEMLPVREGDRLFLSGQVHLAIPSYLQSTQSQNHLVSLLSKRKLAAVYEVEGKDRDALTLLREISKATSSSLANDPLLNLKIIYLASRLGDEQCVQEFLLRVTRAGSAGGTGNAESSFRADQKISKLDRQQSFYSLAMFAGQASDKVLMNWCLDQSVREGDLPSSEWLEAAKVLERVDSSRALSICKRIKPILLVKDAQICRDIEQRIFDRNETIRLWTQRSGKPAQKSSSGDVHRAKFLATGYWPSGVLPETIVSSTKRVP